jgi:hypothetical protein
MYATVSEVFIPINIGIAFFLKSNSNLVLVWRSKIDFGLVWGMYINIDTTLTWSWCYCEFLPGRYSIVERPEYRPFHDLRYVPEARRLR